MLWESTSKILFTRHLEIYSTMNSRSLSYRHKLGEIMQKHKLWESPTGKHKAQCCKDKRWLSCNGNAHHLSFLTSNPSDVLPLSSSWGDMRLNSFSPWLLLAMCTVTAALVCERARVCRQNLGLMCPIALHGISCSCLRNSMFGILTTVTSLEYSNWRVSRALELQMFHKTIKFVLQSGVTKEIKI